MKIKNEEPKPEENVVITMTKNEAESLYKFLTRTNLSDYGYELHKILYGFLDL